MALRKPLNFQSNGFVSNVNSADIRCNQMSRATETLTVAAGGAVGMVSNPAPYHPGPMQFYMAKVPEGQSIDTWDGAGSVWFKVYYKGPASFSSSSIVWPNCTESHSGEGFVSMLISLLRRACCPHLQHPEEHPRAAIILSAGSILACTPLLRPVAPSFISPVARSKSPAAEAEHLVLWYRSRGRIKQAIRASRSTSTTLYQPATPPPGPPVWSG